MTPEAVISGALSAAFEGGVPERLAVAVSGGGDSMAALVLVAGWAAPRNIAVRAVTVDHRLRPEAADEARAVATFCDGRGIAHRTLCWAGWSGQGNLPATARNARYRLIADWARAEGIGAVVLGHTLDDQGETVLMRLARGSGVDGLSGMATERFAHGLRWLRPLLQIRRAALREVLRAGNIGWAEDPGNDNPHYDRVVARRALAVLAPLGIDAEGLAATAARMAETRAALEALARDAAARMIRVAAGDVLIDIAAFVALPRDLRERMFAHALCWVAAADYRPRHVALRAVLDGALAGQVGTLHGCLVSARRGGLRIGREPHAVAHLRAPVGGLWDNRWRLTGPEPVDAGAITEGLEVAALGEAGLRLCPGWRAAGLPRASVLASPAVWRRGVLVAAPLAGAAQGWVATLENGTAGLFKMALSD